MEDNKQKEQDKLKALLNNPDGINGIEDLFNHGDFDTYVIGVARTDRAMRNSVLAKTKKKELLARLFLEKVKTDSASVRLSAETKRNFKRIFDWLNS